MKVENPCRVLFNNQKTSGAMTLTGPGFFFGGVVSFLGLRPKHMGIPRLGVESDL